MPRPRTPAPESPSDAADAAITADPTDAAAPPAGERRSRTATVQMVLPVWPANLVGQPARPVRVLLVEPDDTLRHSLAAQLAQERRIAVVGQATSLRDGRRQVEATPFDVLVVDVNLGDGSGLELIGRARALRPGVEAIVLSAVEDEHVVVQALEAGANGYLLKNSWFDSIAWAVLQVVNGGAPVSSNVVRRLLQRLDGVRAPAPVPPPASSAPPTGEAEGTLSSREREVLRHVARGATSAEVAGYLRISAGTVDAHVKNVYRKLQVRSRAQAVVRAAEQGWL